MDKDHSHRRYQVSFPKFFLSVNFVSRYQGVLLRIVIFYTPGIANCWHSHIDPETNECYHSHILTQMSQKKQETQEYKDRTLFDKNGSTVNNKVLVSNRA